MLFHSQEKERGGAGETGEHMQQNWEFLGHTDLKFKPPDTNVAGHVVHARWPDLVGTVNGGAEGPRAAGPPECHLPASRRGFPPRTRKIQPELASEERGEGKISTWFGQQFSQKKVRVGEANVSLSERWPAFNGMEVPILPTSGRCSHLGMCPSNVPTMS